MNFDVNKTNKSQEKLYIELINNIEKMDVISEIKVLAQSFKIFLKKNIFSIFDILLNSELNTVLFNRKCLFIITCRSQEVYKIINDEVSIVSLIVDFTKRDSTKLQMSNYVQILSQLSLHSVYDFLGMIPNPHTFMVSLIEKEDVCMQMFLLELFVDEMNSRKLFFENAKLPQILLNNLNAKPYFSSVILTYISRLTTRLPVDSPLLEEFAKPKSLLSIINLALASTDHDSSAIAFDLIAYMHSNDILSRESKDVVNSELTGLCNFINVHSNEIFNASSRSCADLIITIIKDMFKPKDSNKGKGYYSTRSKSISTDFSIECQISLQSIANPGVNTNNLRTKLSKGTRQQSSKQIQVQEKMPTMKRRHESMGFFYDPTREASANFSLMSIVSSCPVFSLQKSGLLTIDEEEVKSNIADEDDQEEIIPKSPKICTLDEVVTALTSLIKNFFVYKFNTNLHNCVVEFLDTILDHTDIFPKVVNESNILNYIRDSKKNRGNYLACYWGQINSIISLFKKCEETQAFYEEFKEEYEEYHSITSKHVELPDVESGLFPLSPD